MEFRTRSCTRSRAGRCPGHSRQKTPVNTWDRIKQRGTRWLTRLVAPRRVQLRRCSGLLTPPEAPAQAVRFGRGGLSLQRGSSHTGRAVEPPEAAVHRYLPAVSCGAARGEPVHSLRVWTELRSVNLSLFCGSFRQSAELSNVPPSLSFPQFRSRVRSRAAQTLRMSKMADGLRVSAADSNHSNRQ